MSVLSLADARSTFKNQVVPVNTPTWAPSIAAWYAALVAGMQLSGIGGPGMTLTYAEGVFSAGLAGLTPTTDQQAAIEALKGVWVAAIQASLALVLPGTFLGSSAPATTFSVEPSTTIDAASITAAANELDVLASAKPVADAADSAFPEALRAAALALTVTTVGTDSTPPPSGPLPLTDAARGVV